MRETIPGFYGYFDSPSRLVELDLQPITEDRHNYPGAWSGLPNDTAKNLGLAVYETAWNSGRSDVLLGSTDERLHPHERWLYMYQWSDGQGWYSIGHHFGVLSYINPKNFNATILGLGTRFDIEASRAKCAWTTSNQWQAHLHKRDMAPILQPLLAQTSITPVDLHDLAFHYPKWLARNPEYIDMPRELVWRMHGLGEAAALAVAHREWGTPQMGNDRSFLREGEPTPNW